MTLTPVLLIDVDTTLADVNSYLHHLLPDHPLNLTGKKDFDAFHLGSADAEIVRSTCRDIVLFENGYNLEHGEYPRRVITTAREAVWRELTEGWLDGQRFFYDFMLMRPLGDRRADFAVKRDMVDFLRGQGYEPVHAWDDSPRVLNLYAELGIPATAIPRTFSYESTKTGLAVIA